MRDENRDRGFTLLELIITVAILALISAGGLAALVSYDRSQALNTATYDFVAMLNKAKSRARSQVVNDQSGNNLCGSQQNPPSFSGYEVRLCLSGSTCNSGSADAATYELNIVCGDKLEPQLGDIIETQKLPNGIVFADPGSVSVVRFRSVIGGITSATTISVVINSSQGAESKTINVDPAGNISVN